MKKRNFLKKSIFLGLLFAAGLTVFSCKTKVDPRNEVNPLDLLDNRSSFYLAIPSEQDPNLIVKMLQNNVKNLSEGDAKMVAERIDTIFVGLNKKKKTTEVQLSSRCSIPSFVVPKVFSKKNGWNETKVSFDDGAKKPLTYSIYSEDGLEVSLPDERTCVLGREVQEMLERFHILSSDDEISDENRQKLDSARLTPETFEWLNNNDGEVRFFAQKPQSFLTMLTGANLNFKLVYVKGSMVSDPKRKDKYIMTLDFEFRDSKVLPAAKGVLSLAFGLTDSEVSSPSPTHITISNIQIGKNQLYKLLVI